MNIYDFTKRSIQKIRFRTFKLLLNSYQLIIMKLFRMNLFGDGHESVGEGMEKKASPPTLCSIPLYISHNDETWHSYTLTKKFKKFI